MSSLLTRLCYSTLLLAGLSIFTTPSAVALSVTDMTGHTVEIKDDHPPIADLWFAHNEISVILGAANRIRVSAESPIDSPWLFKVAPVMKNAHTGVKPDTASAENLLALNIGLAFVPTAAKAEELRRMGVPTLCAEYTTLPQMLKSMDMTAQALDTPEASKVAQVYKEDMDATLKQLSLRLANIPVKDRPRVLHIARLNPLQIDGTNTLVDAWIQTAGGQNAATVSGNHRPVSFEQIAAWNPDVIIIGASAGMPDAASPLQSLAAFKNGRAWINPRGVFAWDRYGAEELLQLQWVAQKLHPDLFADIDIRKTTQAFYHKFFHYSLTDQEADLILAGKPPAP
ncbi:sugar ABC transporter substrate-binding protein [Acetobacter aceti 1023]|nr:sugar ABC transporter substrate-binding protein [Acetobacter aceti 1023]